MYNDLTELAPDQFAGQEPQLTERQLTEPQLTEPPSGEAAASPLRQVRRQCVQKYLEHSLALV